MLAIHHIAQLGIRAFQKGNLDFDLFERLGVHDCQV